MKHCLLAKKYTVVVQLDILKHSCFSFVQKEEEEELTAPSLDLSCLILSSEKLTVEILMGLSNSVVSDLIALGGSFKTNVFKLLQITSEAKKAEFKTNFQSFFPLLGAAAVSPFFLLKEI